MKRVLIIGGAGEIGSHLEQTLLARGLNQVAVLDKDRQTRINYYRGDINDIFSLEKVFGEFDPDVVVHLAAMVSRKECEETPQLAIQTNGIGTLNVVMMCLRYNAYLIYSGSSEEYGEAFYGGNRVNEDTPFGTPTSVYAMTKRFSEEIIQYYAEHGNLRACTVRFFMLYSEDEPANTYRSAISRFCHAAYCGLPLEVHLDTLRPWCYVLDAIRAVVHIIDENPTKSYETYLIGKDEPIPTEDLAKKIVGVFKSSSKIVYVKRDPTIIPVKCGDFSKMYQHYGWKADVSLDTGLEIIRVKYLSGK